MFIDGRQALGEGDQSFDLVIIGAGPAGITLAMELAPTGLSIALLESGGTEYEDDPQDLNEGEILGNDDEYYLAGSRLRFLGGTSNHWGGRCVPLDPIDFARAPAPGFSGWPITRASLDQFYERAHVYCDLGNMNYDAAALVPNPSELFLLPDHPEVETTVVRQSTPTRFGEKYQPALTASQNVQVWLYSTAFEVATNPAAPQTVRVVSPDGTAAQFTAQAVVMAGGAIEATRLLMWSNAQNGTGAGDGGGLLGKCYMDHPSGGAGFLHFNTPVTDKAYWQDIDTYADDGTPLHFVSRLNDAALERRALPNFQYYVIPFEDSPEAQKRKRTANRALGSMKGIAKWALGRDVKHSFSPAESYCQAVGGADELIADRVSRLTTKPGYRRALFKYETEQRPDRTNQITLDDTARDATGMARPVLTWSPSDDDINAVKETARLFGEFAGAAGLGRVQLEDHDHDAYWGSTTAWHQLGTMRMADSAQSGVVDADCKVHGAGALYVASGAVFPSVGRANPTLTIVALTIRLADHLKQKLAA